MSYTFKIGEYECEILDEGTEDEHEWHTVAEVKLDEAPEEGFKPTDHLNERWPSYSGWSDFAFEAGLAHLFYDKSHPLCLMPEHPGYAKLTPQHLIEINDAFDNVEEDSYNHIRLVWLQFWIKWALENCERPVITNS